MMKKFLMGTALGAIVLTGGIAVAQPGGPGGEGMRGGMMMKADANGDGVITRDEAQAGAAKAFAMMDANGDGKLTKDDRDAMRQKHLDEMFKRLDADGNGQISKAEFDAGHAARQDRREAMKGKRQGGGMGEMRHGKMGHDGHHRGMGMKMGMGGHGGMMMQADTDKDGAISQAEFSAHALAMFDKADANHDGKVTKDEMQAMHQAMRAKWKGGDMPPPPPADGE